MKTFHSGRRVCCLLLCVLAVLTWALPVRAKSTEKWTAPCAAAPVYYRASSHCAVIGYMEQGTVLTVLDRSGEYYYIDCYDMTGYIPAAFVKETNGTYYVSCYTWQDETAAFDKLALSSAILFRLRLYRTATEQVGVPYVSGGTSPRGFDCSGFTQYVYAQLGISIPRSCDAQLGAGLIIPKEDLQCGDLVLFQRTTSQPGLSTHVGIYLGNGKLIHAGGRGITIVDLNSQYFTEHYLCARRILVSEAPEAAVISAADAWYLE